MKMNRRTIEIIITLGFILFAITVWMQRSKSKQDVLKDYEITKGEIVDYYIVSIAKTRYLEYKYNVDDKEYFRKINPSIYFDKCENNIEFCEEKLFWVIYNPNTPDKSLINLKNEIQGLDSPIFPNSLDNFE
jgi:hypothetical protein